MGNSLSIHNHFAAYCQLCHCKTDTPVSSALQNTKPWDQNRDKNNNSPTRNTFIDWIQQWKNCFVETLITTIIWANKLLKRSKTSRYWMFNNLINEGNLSISCLLILLQYHSKKHIYSTVLICSLFKTCTWHHFCPESRQHICEVSPSNLPSWM